MYPDETLISDDVVTPMSTPVNTQVVRGNLSKESRESHIMIVGDADSARVLECRALAEQSLNEGRTVLYISDNNYCFGLESAYDINRFGPNTHDTEIGASDGAFFAEQAIAGTSIAFSLRAFNERDASRFLKDLLTRLYTSENCQIDLFFENLDDYIGRKRHHGDRTTVDAFKKAMMRGPSSNGAGGNGLRMVMTSKSPAEIPIETGHNSLTLIMTRTCVPANVKAIANYVGDARLSDYYRMAPWGAAHMGDKHLFFWPFVDREMHMPFYNAIPDLVSDAGKPPKRKVDTSKNEETILAKLSESKSQKDAPRASLSKSPKCAKSKSTYSAISTNVRQKVKYSNERVSIARVIRNIENNGEYVPHSRTIRTAEDRLKTEVAACDPILKNPSRWANKCTAARIGLPISTNLAAYAYAQALLLNEQAANDLFNSLLDTSSNEYRDFTAYLNAVNASPNSNEMLQAALAYVKNACAANNTIVVDFSRTNNGGDNAETRRIAA